MVYFGVFGKSRNGIKYATLMKMDLRQKLVEAESRAEQREEQRQAHLQLIRELHHQLGIQVGVAVERLQQLIVEVRASGHLDLLRLWLLWLNELVLARRIILVRSHLLVNELMAEGQQEPSAEAFNLLLTLLKTTPQEKLAEFWPRLSAAQAEHIDAALLLLECQELVLESLVEESKEESGYSWNLGNSLIHLHFEGYWLTAKEEQMPLLLARSLQLLQKLVTRQPDFATQRLPEVMGLVQCYLQYGAEGESQIKPQKIPPAQQSVAYGQEKDESEQPPIQHSRSCGRKNKVRKMRSLAKQRNQEVSKPPEANSRDRVLLMGNQNYGCLTGDSAENCLPSDSDQQTEARHLRQQQARVRISALHLLGALTNQLPRRSLYGYWHVLFPNGDSGDSRHLLLIGLKDSNSRCRALALQLGSQLLYGSKVFLSQACSRGPSNFTPFAVSLGNSVFAAYRALSAILEREYTPPVLTQCLKCLAVLVQATPFDQLEMGFVYEFVGHVKKLTKSADPQVAVSALLVMEMLVGTAKLTPEIASSVGLAPSHRNIQLEQANEVQEYQELCDSDAEMELEEEEEEGPAQKNYVSPVHAVSPSIPRNSWLLRQVLRYLEGPGTPTTVRLESFQVLQAMATHIGLLRGHQARLARVISAGLCDSASDVKLFAARCLDSVGYQLGRLFPEPYERELQISFWLTLLPAIYGAYNNAGFSLKCALCDALSNMGAFSFERLSDGQRTALLAFLSGCASDDHEEGLVRGAALRAMAVYVLQPSLKTDLGFLDNAAELTLRIIGDSQLVVRIKAAWALGNISDALVTGIPNSTERISAELLGRLIQAAMKSCGDNDKVRANAVRALGNLLQFLQLQPLENGDQMQLAMSKLLDCVRSSGNAKVKWNACHAIGNLVKHRTFLANSHLAGILFPALSQLVVQHTNFKVRTNAAGVLLQVVHREDLGSHFSLVWRSLLEGLERSNALDSFEEYNHRDALQQQLCLAISHLLTLAMSSDLPAMRESLEEDRLEQVRATWRRVAYRIVPEQSAPLFTCSPLLEQRLQAEVTTQQRCAMFFITSTLRLDP
ncbi:HEAT repeat-containing protein 6 [Drosophila biarmipes]|uniref:HEAT repeat-containing protein 6 n=1 Tax=Drosophila biarmipes TaxID=125945 RepID=UPI0007E7F29B|nr:HEAT repeat-containing protein 6 [Drosophila biarmipes]